MNGRQRIITALSKQIPDRVPHFELAYNEASIIKIARHFTEDLPKPDYIQRLDLESRVKLFDAALVVIEELDVDGMVLRIFPGSCGVCRSFSVPRGRGSLWTGPSTIRPIWMATSRRRSSLPTSPLSATAPSGSRGRGPVSSACRIPSAGAGTCWGG